MTTMTTLLTESVSPKVFKCLIEMMGNDSKDSPTSHWLAVNCVFMSAVWTY